MSLSEIASALSNARWAKATKRDRQRQGEILVRARKRMPKSQRVAIAKHAGSSITPEAASQRAKKAWETKRRKAAAKSPAA